MRMSWTRAKAIERVKQYNKKGFACSLSLLPILKYSKKEARIDVEEYRALLNDISAHNLDADVTVKVIQFNASAEKNVAGECLRTILNDAAQKNIRVWFDQDIARHITDVLAIVKTYQPEHVGACVQAYHTRTCTDVSELSGYPIRLVKGFYNDYDITPWSRVGDSYATLMERVAKLSPYPCFGTHDRRLVEKAKEILRDREGEVQFFAGIQDGLAEELVQEGYRVRIYVPYGNIASFLLHNLGVCDMPRAIQRILHLPTIY